MSRIVNGPLTNEHNEKFREESLKKLQGSMKNLDNFDFSNAGSVHQALSLMDPISKDKDFAYDLYFTEQSRKQTDLMESYRTSTDMDKRAMYNVESAMDIQFAKEDMRNAKRGDGSIRSVQHGEFTPFEDHVAFLDEKAKAEGLEIKIDSKNGMYLVSTTNGTKAVPAFEQWAQVKMGDRFDKQFQLKGRMRVEGQVRASMKKQGISRAEAIGGLASIETPTQAKIADNKNSQLQRDSDLIDREIKMFDDAYGVKGIPANMPEQKERYDELKEQQGYYKDALVQSQGTQKAINEEAGEFLASNLSSLFASQSKSGAIHSWAKAKAESSVKYEMKPDQVALTQYKAKIDMKIHNDNMIQKQMFHNDAMNIKQAEYNIKQAEFLTKARNGYWTKNGKGNGKSGSGKNINPAGSNADVEHISTWAPTESKRAINAMGEAMSSNTQKIYANVMDSGKGFLSMMNLGEDYNETSTAINKIQQAANGNDIKFTEREKQLIEKLGKRIQVKGLDVSNYEGGNSQKAVTALDAIMTGVYMEAGDAMEALNSSGTFNGYTATRKQFTDTYYAMEDNMNNQKVLDKTMKELHQTITDSNGNLLDAYEGAVLRGVTYDGVPQWDMDGVSDDAKSQLKSLLPNVFKDELYPMGQVYNMHNISGGEFEFLFENEAVQAYDEDGELVDVKDVIGGNITGKPTEFLKKIFGDEIKAAYDPVTKEAIYTLKVDNSSTEAKSSDLKDGAVYKFKVPMSSIKANAAAVGRFATFADKNTALETMVPAEMKPLVKNHYATIHSNTYMDKAGFKYSVGGSHQDSQYGLNVTITYYDAVEKKNKTTTQFMAVNNMDSPTAYNNIDEQLNAMFEYYMQDRINVVKDGYENGSIDLDTKLKELPN